MARKYISNVFSVVVRMQATLSPFIVSQSNMRRPLTERKKFLENNQLVGEAADNYV